VRELRSSPWRPRSVAARWRRRPLVPIVASFEQVPEAQSVGVELPSDPAAPPRTLSVRPPLAGLCPPWPPRSVAPRVTVLPQAALAYPSGAVLSSRGEIVMETLWDLDHWSRDFNPPPELPAPTVIRGRHASLISLWSHNYFHWLFEALPRLAVLRASGVSYDGVIVPARLSAFHEQTLELAGVPRERWVPFTGMHVIPDELVWAAPLAPIGFPTPYLIEWLRQTLGSAAAGPPHRRIYLARRGSRRITNERAVLEVLRPLGIEPVDSEDLALRAQIDLFSTAELLIGSHGAAFANGIFSSQLTALEFYQPAHVNASITAVLAAAGHTHWSLVGRQVRQLGHKTNDHVSVGLDELRETLALMDLS